MRYIARATGRPPHPITPGSKMSRECRVCGAAPYHSCIGTRSGSYTQEPYGHDGSYTFRLKFPHKDR